jgi:catecholate siderophore receptor
LIEDQGITQTRDALRNVPGVSLGAGEAGAQGDNLTLRGFSARNDFFLDGMRDFGSYYRDPFDLESIEVLKGPSSVAFGRGSTGGYNNQVSKAPGLAPLTAGSIAFGTDGTKRITADVNRAIDGLPGAAVRLNVMADENGIADRNADTYRRFGFAPSIAFGLGTPTRVVLSYLHQQSYDTPDYGLPWLFGSPASVPRQTFYGFKNDDHLRTTVDVVTAKAEHDFGSNLTVRDQFRYGNYSRDIRVTEPQIVYRGVTDRTPLGQITVNRNIIAVKSTETFLQNQSDVTVRFDTGPLRHVLVAGVEAGQETSSPVRFTYAGVPSTNLLNPNGSQPFLASATIASITNSRVNEVAGYAIDTIKLGEQWDLTAGFRYDYLDTKYGQQVAPAVHLQRVDTVPSYRAALAYHPVPGGTLYVAYGTSFNPSADGLTLAVNNAGLAPEKNTTYEVGAKWEVLDRRLTLSTALFQLEKTNARVTDPNNSLFQILGGDQRVRGVEFGVAGNLTDRWLLNAGYAYLDSDTVKTTLALTQGQVLANTPKHSGSLFTTYALPFDPFRHGDVQIGGGVDFVSSRLASSSPDTTSGAYKKAAGYATVQAVLKVPVRDGLVLQLNGYNLTNQKYYDLIHPAHVVPGAGRSLLASLNFRL